MRVRVEDGGWGVRVKIEDGGSRIEDETEVALGPLEMPRPFLFKQREERRFDGLGGV